MPCRPPIAWHNVFGAYFCKSGDGGGRIVFTWEHKRRPFEKKGVFRKGCALEISENLAILESKPPEPRRRAQSVGKTKEDPTIF